MKKVRKQVALWALMSILLVALFLPPTVQADAIVGETVVTFGQDLTAQQKQAVMNEMNVGSDVRQITISIPEVTKYLGQHLDRSVIGTKAISSAKITLKEKGYGIQVQTNNITTITKNMYANALFTAGVTDADVYVTAPFKVTGTTGLTGILKAFEEVSDTTIDEDKKQVANEELVRTSEIAEKIGDSEKAAEFVMKVKEEVAEKQPKNKEEVRTIIINVSNQYNIDLNQQEIENMTLYAERFSKLDIDWESFGSQLKKLGDQLGMQLDKVGEAINSEDTRNFFQVLWGWIVDFFNWIGSLFS